MNQTTVNSVGLGLVAVVILSYCSNTEAKMCKAKNESGEDVFMWATDVKTGKLMITKSASGVIATMESCPSTYNLTIPAQYVEGVKLRAGDISKVEIPVPVETPVLPVDTNEFLHESCRRTLSAVCDPAYGAMKLYPNPGVDASGNILANCIGFKIVAGEDDAGVMRYTNVQMYSGIKQREDGSQYCVFDESLTAPFAPNDLPVIE